MMSHNTSLAVVENQTRARRAMAGGDNSGPKELERLCRLVISRYDQLRRLLDTPAPAIIVHNEARMLRIALAHADGAKIKPPPRVIGAAPSTG